MTTTQSQSYQPAPFTKRGLSYGINGYATIKYHWVHAHKKDFGGGYLIPSVKGLNKYFGNTTVTTTQSQSYQPAPFTKEGLSYGINGNAFIKYHWVHVQ
jgi:hypothetical protein